MGASWPGFGLILLCIFCPPLACLIELQGPDATRKVLINLLLYVLLGGLLPVAMVHAFVVVFKHGHIAPGNKHSRDNRAARKKEKELAKAAKEAKQADGVAEPQAPAVEPNAPADTPLIDAPSGSGSVVALNDTDRKDQEPGKETDVAPQQDQPTTPTHTTTAENDNVQVEQVENPDVSKTTVRVMQPV